MRPRGVALMTSLLVAAVLLVMAAAVLEFHVQNHQAAETRRRALQAYWNARAGVEVLRVRGTLPAPDADGVRRIPIGSTDSTEACTATQDPTTGTIVFEGVSGRVHRRIVVPNGDLTRFFPEAPH